MLTRYGATRDDLAELLADQPRYRVDQVTPISLLMPVVGVISGILMLGEQLTLPELFGGAIVMAGLAVVVLAPGPVPAAAEAPGG